MSADAVVEPATSARHRQRRRPLIVRWGTKAREPLNRLLSRFSLVPLTPFLSTGHFLWLRHLEAAAPAIQGEVEQLLRNIAAVPPMNEMSPDHDSIASEGGWRTFFLVAYQYRLEANRARCPETVKALSHVPGLVTALFSILDPGMHVGRHTGISKGVLIAHLGLRVPREATLCRLEVEDTQVHWQEGATLVFDDTFPHEVWNDSTDHRVILLVQFERPMSFLGKALMRLLLPAVRWSPYIQDALRNVDIWEKRFRASEAQTAGRLTKAAPEPASAQGQAAR